MNIQKTTVLAGTIILVVEDDPFIAMDLQDCLCGLGAEVLGPLPAVRPALEALEAVRPDLAVLDVNLRGEMSTPVANALSAAGVPFVLVTGYSRQQLDPALRDLPILPKPVSTCQLSQLLQRLLAESRSAG